MQVSQQSQWISRSCVAGDTVAPSLAPHSKLGGRQLLPSANDVVPEGVIAPGMGKAEDMRGAELA